MSEESITDDYMRGYHDGAQLVLEAQADAMTDVLAATTPEGPPIERERVLSMLQVIQRASQTISARLEEIRKWRMTSP